MEIKVVSERPGCWLLCCLLLLLTPEQWFSNPSERETALRDLLKVWLPASLPGGSERETGSRAQETVFHTPPHRPF